MASSGHGEHDHGHAGGHDHDHDHSDDLTPALQSYIYQQIEFDQVVTLNERVSGSGGSVLKKGWEKRLEVEPSVMSDADEQLLMYIPYISPSFYIPYPFFFFFFFSIFQNEHRSIERRICMIRFTGQIKLHSLLIRGDNTGSAPKTVKLFLNRDDLDFSSANDLTTTQTLYIPQSASVQDIPLKRALWNTTRSITLFFVDNHHSANPDPHPHGDDDDEDDFQLTRFSFLGFRGHWMPLNREPVNVLYEAASNPNDHTPIVGIKDGLSRGVGGGGGGGADDRTG